MQRYGRKMRTDSLVTTLHRFEDDIAEGLNGPARVSLSYLLYEKAPMLSYALSSASIAFTPPSAVPREEPRASSADQGQTRVSSGLSKKERKRLLDELRRGLDSKSARSGDDKTSSPSPGKRAGADADKGEGKFERVQGGNPKNPAQCTAQHSKGAWCRFNHSNKD